MLIAETVQVTPWVGAAIIGMLIAAALVVAGFCAGASYVTSCAVRCLRHRPGRPAAGWPWLTVSGIGAGIAVFAFWPLGIAAAIAIGVAWGYLDNGRSDPPAATDDPAGPAR